MWLHEEGRTRSLWETLGFRRMEMSESEWGEKCDFKMSAALNDFSERGALDATTSLANVSPRMRATI
jgi:hypothetical protein